jgi:hypothetical protein
MTRNDKIRWREEWEKKSVAEVQEFLRSIEDKSPHELSIREWDFLLLIQEKHTAWAKPRNLKTFNLAPPTRH